MEIIMIAMGMEDHRSSRWQLARSSDWRMPSSRRLIAATANALSVKNRWGTRRASPKAMRRLMSASVKHVAVTMGQANIIQFMVGHWQTEVFRQRDPQGKSAR